MKFDFVLSQEQQALAESNLAVIDKVIARCIHANEGVCGLGRDDLYQEGAAALCKAAATYDGTSAQFSTYAATVVRNHLLNHCRAVNASQRNLPAVSLDDSGQEDGRPPPCPEPSVPDGVDELLGRLDTADLLADCKRRYIGAAGRGGPGVEGEGADRGGHRPALRREAQ